MRNGLNRTDVFVGLFCFHLWKERDFLPNLIVAEKPSVAQAIAKAMSVTTRRDGYWEGGGYLVSWCVGHLVGLAPPGLYDPRFERWDRADLPILPEKWQYLVSSSTCQRRNKKCLKRRPQNDPNAGNTYAG